MKTVLLITMALSLTACANYSGMPVGEMNETAPSPEIETPALPSMPLPTPTPVIEVPVTSPETTPVPTPIPTPSQETQPTSPTAPTQAEPVATHPTPPSCLDLGVLAGAATTSILDTKIWSANVAGSVVAAGAMDLQSSSVQGSVIYGSGLSVSGASMTGEARQMNLSSMVATIRSASSRMSAMTPNGVATMKSWGTLEMVGTDERINIFHVSAQDLSWTNNVKLSVPEGSTAVINVDGARVSMKNMGLDLGPSTDKVVINFLSASVVEFSGLMVKGFVMAPEADLSLANGGSSGTLVGRNLQITGTPEAKAFTGCVPAQ